MAKNKISEWSPTPANNTDVGGIDIAEGCAPSGINNAIREVMAQVKDMQSGADGDNFTVGGNLTVDGTSTLTGAVTATAGVTGDVTGNVTGNVTGDVTGTAANVTGTVAVVNGGTGLTTLTANNLMLGNGTATPTFVAPSTSGNVLTSNGTTWQSSALPDMGIGVGQTWQNVSGSRAEGTTYTNNTGKPIMVSYGFNSTNGFNRFTAYVGSVIVGVHQEVTPASTAGGGSVSFIVPDSATYSIVASGTYSRAFWSELR